MKIILPNNISLQMQEALLEASNREVGGILMAEHVGKNCFRIVDITIQKHGGTVATFIRVVSSALNSLTQFFKKTNYNYRRFNYLGEWHSHPQFALRPSDKDVASMFDIVSDPSVGANFVVLLLVKLSEARLQTSCWFFLPSGKFYQGYVVLEKSQ